MLPGRAVENHAPIVEAMRRRLNPASLTPIELMRTWRRVDPAGSEVDGLLKANTYYLFHEHPVHSFKDRLSEANRDEVRQFLKERFRPERMEGMDVIVFSDQQQAILIGNHDGELFVAV